MTARVDPDRVRCEPAAGKLASPEATASQAVGIESGALPQSSRIRPDYLNPHRLCLRFDQDLAQSTSEQLFVCLHRFLIL